MSPRVQRVGILGHTERPEVRRAAANRLAELVKRMAENVGMLPDVQVVQMKPERAHLA